MAKIPQDTLLDLRNEPEINISVQDEVQENVNTSVQQPRVYGSGFKRIQLRKDLQKTSDS